MDALGKPRKSHTRQEFSVPRDWLLWFSNCADLNFLEWGSPVPPCLKWPSDPASSWMTYRRLSAFAIATGDRAARRLYFATSDDCVYNCINEWYEEIWNLKIGYFLFCSKSRLENYTINSRKSVAATKIAWSIWYEVASTKGQLCKRWNKFGFAFSYSSITMSDVVI